MMVGLIILFCKWFLTLSAGGIKFYIKTSCSYERPEISVQLHRTTLGAINIYVYTYIYIYYIYIYIIYNYMCNYINSKFWNIRVSVYRLDKNLSYLGIIGVKKIFDAGLIISTVEDVFLQRVSERFVNWCSARLSRLSNAYDAHIFISVAKAVSR